MARLLPRSDPRPLRPQRKIEDAESIRGSCDRAERGIPTAVPRSAPVRALRLVEAHHLHCRPRSPPRQVLIAGSYRDSIADRSRRSANCGEAVQQLCRRMCGAQRQACGLHAGEGQPARSARTSTAGFRALAPASRSGRDPPSRAQPLGRRIAGILDAMWLGTRARGPSALARRLPSTGIHLRPLPTVPSRRQRSSPQSSG